MFGGYGDTMHQQNPIWMEEMSLEESDPNPYLCTISVPFKIQSKFIEVWNSPNQFNPIQIQLCLIQCHPDPKQSKSKSNSNPIPSNS